MTSVRFWAGLLVASVTATACGSVDTHDMRLLTTATWKELPASAAEIGFWISVDFGWPDRAQQCFPLSPSLRVTVNDREAQQARVISGDCNWDVLFEVGPFSADAQPTTVRVLDGAKTLGEASYTGLYPAFPAALTSPVDGRIRAGESFTMGMTVPFSSDLRAFEAAKFFWLDPAPAVPPYHEWATIQPPVDPQAITIRAPTTTGRAAVVIPVFGDLQTTTPSCVGFAHCYGQTNDNVGPVYVEVIP